jgi:general secretion pathway protein C
MATSSLLEKHSWCILLAPIAALAYVSARTVTTFAGALLLPASTIVSGAGVVGVPEGEPQRSPSADAILARNPFDHTTGSLSSRPGSEDTSDTSVPGGPISAPPCEGVVVHAIAASADPNWSFAVLAASSETKSQLKRRGGDIGGRTVQFVGWDRVWMRSASGLCQIGFGRTVTSPKPRSIPAADAPGTLDPSIRKGIVSIGPTEFAVDRATLDKIIEGQAELVRARATPESENGKVVGIRLSAIRKDSVLSALGLEDGDRLQTINGFDITVPEKALEAYARLRQADKLSVTVNRRGRDMTLDYTVR